MKRQLLITALLSLAFAPAAYAEDDSDIDYTKGVFIVNEDWYGHQNSTVNYLLPDEEDENCWHYRVIQAENPGMELGCTNQYGAIWDGRFYLIAKQEKDPGASITGGRITVADAKTMKILYQNTLIDPSGKQCDGRGFVGVDAHKGYISSSNGIWIFDLDNLEVKGLVEGTGNPNAGDDKPNTDPTGSLYKGQTGSMVRAGNRVFAAHQQYGLLVIDPIADKVTDVIPMSMVSEKAGIGSVVVAKDGSVWASVTKDTKGDGSALPYIVRIDPNTLDTEVVPMADGIYPPANSWYAWTPDGLCASYRTNTLYWNGGKNSWFTSSTIFKFDIDTRTSKKIIDLSKDAENWKLYGCSMRVHPQTDELYLSLYHIFQDPTYITRRYDADGNKLRDYPMISNYWFPSLPVFPLAPDNFSNAGVSAPDADHSIDIRVENGSVYADGCTDLHVYTLDGRQMPSQNLAPGLYIIRAGNVTKKIKI